MLQVTYTYTCDCCHKPIRDPQTFNATATMPPPLPQKCNSFLNFILCDGCSDRAWAALQQVDFKS